MEHYTLKLTNNKIEQSHYPFGDIDVDWVGNSAKSHKEHN